MALYKERGEHSPYFQRRFIDGMDERARRSAEDLSTTVLNYLDGAETSQWGFDLDHFLRHLAYDCDACYGDVEITDTCDRIVTSKCNGDSCTRCDGQNQNCVDTCDNWSPSTPPLPAPLRPTPPRKHTLTR